MDDCIFCKFVTGELDCHKVFENDHVLAFLDNYPVSAYHTLVIPRQHYRDIFEIPADTLKEVIAAVREISILYKQKLGIDNIHVLNNSGKYAQQSVFHVHFHIIPRSPGDDNNLWQHKHPELVDVYDQMLKALQ